MSYYTYKNKGLQFLNSNPSVIPTFVLPLGPLQSKLIWWEPETIHPYTYHHLNRQVLHLGPPDYTKNTS